MKRFFKGSEENIDGNINLNDVDDFENKNFKKTYPNISLKRSWLLVIILLSAIIGGMIIKLLDVYIFKDGFIETRNVKIDSDGIISKSKTSY